MHDDVLEDMLRNGLESNTAHPRTIGRFTSKKRAIGGYKIFIGQRAVVRKFLTTALVALSDHSGILISNFKRKIQDRQEKHFSRLDLSAGRSAQKWRRLGKRGPSLWAS